jgi:KaiC/GvpD/RAD55 family RecA-like ATPase
MIKEPKSIRAIPKEIVDFFSHEGGHSLLVEGGAGTGKTTFVLQLLEELADPIKSFYLSTRVSDDTLYSQFPWLKDKEMRGRVIDSSRMLLDALLKRDDFAPKPPTEEIKKTKAAKEFLQSLKKDKDKEVKKEVDRTQLHMLLDRYQLPEVERIYDRIEACLPESAMLVLDSVEGITHKYAINQEEFITAIQKDLVEHSNVDLLLVLERLGASHLEYIVDGVISFARLELDGRRVREIHIAKLRATEIRQPNYLLTLRSGRFNCFEPFLPVAKNAEWKPTTDNGQYFSTGVSDLDGLLGGGFRKGSYNIIETTDKVSNDEYLAIIRPILLNFISQGRGVLGTLPGGDHPENLRNDLTRFVPTATFDKCVRIVEYLGTQSEPYVIALGGKGREDAVRLYKENITAIRGPENKAIIDFNGLDTLEYLRGGDVAIRDLFSAVAKVKISEDVGIGILKPGLKITQEIMNMADTYLRIIDVNRCPCIYGIKPKTIMHAITTDKEKGYPNIRLIPIV